MSKTGASRKPLDHSDNRVLRKQRRLPAWVWLCTALTLLVLAGALSWTYHLRPDGESAKTYRIGVDHNPPNHDWSEEKGASGFAVDVLNEAARRAGVQLNWVYCPRGSKAAMLEGFIDLWPVGYFRPGEYPTLYQTRPWSYVQHAWVWDRKKFAADPDRTARKRLSAVDRFSMRNLVSRTFPNMELVPAPTRRESLSAMCSGKADLTFIDMRVLEEALLDRPESCRGTIFVVKPLPDLTDPMTIFARGESTGVADALRNEIDGMLTDGTILNYSEQWFALSSSEERQVSQLQERNLQLKWMAGICLAMAVAIGLLVWLIRNLRSARAGADRARRLQAEFLANVSHEIRTPMNGVLGTAELMLDTVDDPVIREQVETIRESALGQLELLNQILDQSKIDSGVLLLEITPFSLRRLMEHIERTFWPAARRKGIWLRLDIPPDLPDMVQGDGLRIRQVLTNLVNNAVKFTAEGGVDIAVRSDVSPNGVKISFSISDTGIGIPAAVQETIFEKFRQVDASTTRRYGGTGLGLSISRQLVRLMGGDLTVESDPGQGSKFRFSVDLTLSRNAGKRELPAGSANVATLAGLNVLVVEDNLVNQRVAQALLQRLGASVLLAGNGVEAVAKCREREFDVVLMDCHMPEMDGFTATMEIRKLDGAIRRVPIVALTAGVSGEERRKAMLSGMDGFLTKPVNRDELAAILVDLPRGPSTAA